MTTTTMPTIPRHPLLLLYVSLTVNILVVFPLSIMLLIIKPKRVDKVYGPDTDARKILASIYFAIGVASTWTMYLLWKTTSSETTTDDTAGVITMALSIFYLQIIYKLTTIFTVGIQNPVVVANVFISMLHLMTAHSVKHVM